MRLTVTPENRQALMTKFLERCGQSDVDGECWIWQGAVTGSPGRHSPFLCHDWIGTQARRVAWELYWGKIPDGQYVNRSCANTMCVNPAHLCLYGGSPDGMYRGRETGAHRRLRLMADRTARKNRDAEFIVHWRELGMSWLTISEALGLSESAAWKRHHRAGRRRHEQHAT